MRPSLRTVVYGCLALGIGLSLLLWPSHSDTDPYAQAIIAAHTRKMAADAQDLREARTALARADTSATRTIVRYRAVRGIAGDTVRLTDTVWIKALIASSDSVVKSCTDLQESCARFRVRADSVIAGLHVENAALAAQVKALHPSRVGTLWNRVKVPLAFVAGAWIGAKVTR